MSRLAWTCLDLPSPALGQVTPTGSSVPDGLGKPRHEISHPKMNMKHGLGSTHRYHINLSQIEIVLQGLLLLSNIIRLAFWDCWFQPTYLHLPGLAWPGWHYPETFRYRLFSAIPASTFSILYLAYLQLMHSGRSMLTFEGFHAGHDCRR